MIYSFWRCAGSAGVYLSVGSGKDTNERNSHHRLLWRTSISAKGCDNIGINMHTVNKAYTVLKQEGFVKLDRRKGAVISLNADKIRALEEIEHNSPHIQILPFE